MAGPERIAEETLLLRGSPQTVFYELPDGGIIVVDPGHGRKRAKQIARITGGYGRTIVLLTHGHTDHVDVLSYTDIIGRHEVLATSIERPMVEHPVYRVSMTFGLPLRRGSGLLLYDAKPVRVSREIPYDQGRGLGPEPIPGLEDYNVQLVPLPGHTPGHAGFLLGGVLAAGDAIFGDRVLEGYIAPYHMDPCTARRSLAWIRALYEEGLIRVVVPGHGPVVRGDSIPALVEANIASIDRFATNVYDVLEEAPRTAGEIVSMLPGAGRVEKPGLLLLAEVALKGLLACLEEKGAVRARVEDGRVVWSLEKRVPLGEEAR